MQCNSACHTAAFGHLQRHGQDLKVGLLCHSALHTLLMGLFKIHGGKSGNCLSMHSVGAAVDGQRAKHQIAGAHLCKLDKQWVGVEHCSCVICTGCCEMQVLDSTAWPAK